MVSDVSPAAIEGGGERVLWEEAFRLVRRGHRVFLVSRLPAQGARETVEREGVRIQHYPVDRRSSLRFLFGSILQARRAVARAMAEERFDLLHMHQPLSGYGALRAGRDLGLPSLYTFHSPAPLEYILRRGMTAHHRPGLVGRATQALLWGIERTCLRRATRIRVLSDFSAGLIWKLYGIGADRLVKIPGGADLKQFHPAADRYALREALGLPARSPLLLTVRNLEARMGLDTLIRAMAILRRRIPDATLLIGGAGSLRGCLESLAVSLNLQQHVRFLGYIPEPDLPRYYQAADAFVLPTRELEGFGLITVESLASGTPVLGTPVGATPEILGPLDPSLLFREGTPEAMAEDLARFLDAARRDPAASRALREACRRHAERHYSWEDSVARLEAALRDLSLGPDDPPLPRPCPACGGLLQERDLTYLGTPYLRCPRCRSAGVATLPTAASLRRQYEIEYPRQFRHERVSGLRADLFASVLDRLQALGGRGRLLDVGCGGGHLLATAIPRGWSALGTDLSHHACAAAHRSGAPVVQADGAALPLRDGAVGAVSLVNVLDHTADPAATLREAYRVVRPGGHLAVRIPNVAFHRPWIRLLTSLGPLVRWEGWDGYPILHLFAFTPGGLRSVVVRAGFQVLEIRNSCLTAEGFPWRPQGAKGRAGRWLSAAVAAGAAAVAFLSGGRRLAGPSIELYAVRPPAGDEGKP
jgi:glycosyltransferase involved in cell wall biosynthesis/SAM-dependent methyltransferase